MGDSLTSRPPLLTVRGLKKWFPIRKGLFGKIANHVKAVDGVDFEIGRGETLSLVGESGCGKTTVGRVVLNLISATEGEVSFHEHPAGGGAPVQSPNLARMSQRQWLPFRRRMQMIFQDPFSSLNPRMPVGAMIGEALAIHNLVPRGPERQKRITQLLEQVGLPADAARRFPHEFSGGQRQRIGIARALAVEPQLIIADEPVSALDVSIQAQVINLLEDLQREMHLSFLFISHDLSVVAHLSHRVAVMYLGRIVEIGPKTVVFDNPKHPYTKALLSAVPRIDKAHRTKRVILEGDVPNPVNPPAGCHFHPRCPARFGPCDSVAPVLRNLPDGSRVACHLFDPQYASQAAPTAKPAPPAATA